MISRRFKKFINIVLPLLLIACSHNGHDEAGDHKGGMNDKFTDPNMNVNRWVKGFESDDRDVFIHRENIVSALKLKEGSCVADIGAGTGGFLPLLHKEVGPKGKVYAVEISDGFLEYMAQRVKVEKLSSVEVTKGGLHSTNLLTQSCDVLLLVDVYHHLDNTEEMLRDFHRVLRPQGLLAIVDFNRIEGKSRPWILKHMKYSKDEVIDQVKSLGFRFQSEPRINFEENFMLVFKKD